MSAIQECDLERQDAVLGDLKKLAIQYDALTWKAGAVSACIKLGNLLRRTYKNVEHWYYSGKYMHDHELAPGETCHRSVRAVYQVRKSLEPEEQEKCLELIRAKRPFEEVSRLIKGSERAARTCAEKLAKKQSNKGELSEESCRIRLVSLKAMLDEYFGGSVTIRVAIGDEEKLCVE